jgi:23S rRNA (adenine-N6)-dimethyltransferase
MMPRVRRPADSPRRATPPPRAELPSIPAAERFVAEAGVEPGELVVDIGAGSGAITHQLLRRGARVVAVEADPAWAGRLAEFARQEGRGRLRVVEADFLAWPLPAEPFRVTACLPFGATTAILHRLFDKPEQPVVRAEVIVQWEVARKRAASPPDTLVSTTWAPWWQFRQGRRVPAQQFRPVPRVDGGVLVATRRQPPLLPTGMAGPYAEFVRHHWPFRDSEPAGPVRSRRG